MMMAKKSQTELLGIAIVVIILSIGILILISNAMKSNTTSNQKREFSEKQLATNILGAILSTSTNCSNDRISTLLIDCGKCVNCRTCGGQEGDIYILPTGVCNYTEQIISYMLNNTLESWNKKYEFKAYTTTSNVLINVTHNVSLCGQYIQKDFYYLPLYPDTLTVELGLCS